MQLVNATLSGWFFADLFVKKGEFHHFSVMIRVSMATTGRVEVRVRFRVSLV